MSWKKNQMFWLVSSVSLLCLLLFLAYESFVLVHPIPTSALKQTPYSKKPDTKEVKVQTYFQRFPERYIRIIDEYWQHEPAAHLARHTLTLENIAAVAYRDIEIRFRYESADGKVVHTWIEKLPGPLAAGQKMAVKSLEVRDIPPSTASVVTTIAGAQVVQ
jgi:hypothetical protein